MTMPSNARKLSDVLPSRPVAMAFLIGLLAGPVMTGYAGLTVSAGTAESRLNDSARALEVDLCTARAQAEVPEPAKLTQAARRDLAAKHAVVRSTGIVDYGVVELCRQRLGA